MLIKGWETKSVCDCDYFKQFHPVSLCFTLFPCVLHSFLNLFDIKFVANRALWVALNLSQITHFWCKFLGPKNPLV